MRDAALLAPCHEGATVELRRVVGIHGVRIAAEPGGLVQHSRDMVAVYAMVDRDVDAFEVKSSATVRLFMRRPLAGTLLTKSMLQTALVQQQSRHGVRRAA